jgi:hypothetical protein
MSEQEDDKKEQLQRLLDYKDRQVDLIGKSEDSFEKQLSFISSGAIAGSFLIVEKFFEKPWTTSYLWILLIALILLTSVLLINLLSHVKSSEGYSKVVDDIEENGLQYNYQNAIDCRQAIRKMNVWGVWFLFSGIILVVIFILLNLFIMNNSKVSNYPKKTSIEKFGRAGTVPPKPEVINSVPPSQASPTKSDANNKKIKL